MHINLRQIEVFVTVAHLTSFSAAAEKLCIAQSAVSIAIRRLEENLGTRLLHRTRRTVELTPAGQAFLLRVQPALAQLTMARDEVRAMESGLQGTLLAAAPAMVTQTVLAPRLVGYQREHPGVKLILRQGGARTIEQWVSAGEIELGVIAGGKHAPGLEMIELFNLPNVACLPATAMTRHTLSWQALLTQPMVSFPAGYHQRSLIDKQARRLGIVPPIVMESENISVLLEAVRQGIGATVVPEPATENKAGIVTCALEEDDVLHVVLCHRKDYPLSPPAQALITHLQMHTP